jgi:hypothetical protein
MRYRRENQSILGLDVPVGIWLICDHNEACALTDDLSVKAVLSMIPPIPVWGQLLSAAIVLQSAYIRNRNEESGGRGVELLYSFGVGVITNVKRRGRGRSPCTPLLVRSEARLDDIRPLPLLIPTEENLKHLDILSDD